ncbi:unnamed protein product, partial [Vitis vinifera]
MAALLSLLPNPFSSSSSSSSPSLPSVPINTPATPQFSVALSATSHLHNWVSVINASITRTSQLKTLLLPKCFAINSTISSSDVFNDTGSLFSLFQGLGVDEREVELLLNKNPALRLASFDCVHERVCSLESLGINGVALYSLITKCPDVLTAPEIDPLISFIRDDLEGKIEPAQICRLLKAAEPRFLVGFDGKVRLLVHHGIPQERIAHVLNNVNLTRAICLKSAEEIEKTFTFLSRFGAVDIIIKRPAILNYDLESQLIPRVRVLVELSGGDDAATGVVLRKLPAILRYSEEHLGGHVEFLRSFAGLSDQEIFKIVCVFPNVFSASKERKLNPRIDFLKQCGLNSYDIFRFLIKAPLFLGLSFEENLVHKLSLLVKIGYQYRTRELAIAMGAVTRTSCENLQKVIGLFLSYGLSCEDIVAMSNKHPQILQYNPTSLKEKIEYLIEDMGREVDELLAFPAFLGYKLDDRIKHRYEVKKKIIGEGMSLNKLLSVYIVYMGERQHGNLDLITDGHHRMLSEVLGSDEASVESMVYSYKHGFSGFAAKLTEAQAQMFAELPDVVQVIPNRLHKLQTTRSWDYLGLPLDSPTSLLHETKMGDGTIIGLLDTGIWPESEVFMRGGAPRARLAMYKVCWNLYGGVCADADIFKGIDEAIHDGVDVLSLSISSDIPLFSHVDQHDGISIASFHAVVRGIPVVSAAGNSGPSAETVSNTAPWIITVAASTMDRLFATHITLGNNQTITGEAVYLGKDTGFTNLAYPEVSDLLAPRYCESLLPNDTFAAGNVVLCFTSDSSHIAAESVKKAGGLGVIVASNVKNDLSSCSQNFPCIQVSNEIGARILDYIRSTRHPQVRLSPSRTHLGNPVPTKVASFSSRGPSSIAPAILKPDIAGPGFQILGAEPSFVPTSTKYYLMSGTSMATPHVSGAVALLRALNREWSPAAIKSAIVTTAWTTDPSGEPVFAEGQPMKLADPFDFGGGILNPNGAGNPGLVYDMGKDDCILYLCAMGYNNSAIAKVTGRPTSCPCNRPSILDVNLPSITIPNLQYSVSLTRSVTNVGAVDSEYNAVIDPPPGVTIKLEPDRLVFNSKIRTITFRVMVSSARRVSTGFSFGSLAWSDGEHAVRIPISVRTHTMSSLHHGSLMLIFLASSILILNEKVSSVSPAQAKSKVHIVYLGKRQHHDPEFITNTHHEMLTTVLGSKEASVDSMLYSYRHGFSGFAAKLTEAQAQAVSELPDVVQVMPSRLHKLKTTRSWDYLGLSSSHSSTNLLHETNMGDGIIIGLLDSGIWPESKVFSDKGLGPIPSRWKGGCSSGQSFNATKHCNRKLIGARYFLKGLEAEIGEPLNTTKYLEYLSPRDALGHGTHTSSIAGGSPVVNASYYGLGFGTVRGGAPGARLAMYKACWNLGGGFCSDADILKAFDKAIHDGVDVILIGSFHAVAQGISVVCAAGNGGPSAQTVENTAPWILTVAASSIDRSFPTPITLGNNRTVMGQAMLIGNHTGFASLVYPDDPHLQSPSNCLSISPNDTSVAGKVALCFTSGTVETEFSASFVKAALGLGVIIAENSGNTQASCISDFPCIKVSYETGSQILHYISSTRHPHVRLSPSKTHVGKPVPTNVAYFSSRGPSFPSPAVLKPDIAGPGAQILGAVPPSDLKKNTEFAFHSGTSMATPHIAGIVALLKSLHPHWSPAAIKSAIVTTGWTTDPSGEPIFAEGDPTKLADPFDFGGGIVNPNRAADPGLVYDMGTADYIHYLCTLGYNNSAIFQFTEQSIRCPTREHSILDLNLPSITIPSLQNSTSLTRNVTNVGAVNSTYKASIISPAGTTITVKPDTLIFDSTIKTVTFSVTVSSIQQVNTGYSFGSLTWIDGVHAVRSPISVRTMIKESYANDS